MVFLVRMSSKDTHAHQDIQARRKGKGDYQLLHKQNYRCLLPLQKLLSLTCANGRAVT